MSASKVGAFTRMFSNLSCKSFTVPGLMTKDGASSPIRAGTVVLLVTEAALTGGCSPSVVGATSGGWIGGCSLDGVGAPSGGLAPVWTGALSCDGTLG